MPRAMPASNRIHGRSRLRGVSRQTTSLAASSASTTLPYHSSPNAIPSVPCESDDRKQRIMFAVTTRTRSLNKAASSASRLSWLMNT